MADSFFGFDTSLSNLNDDEGGGEGSEGEYDALNDETFGFGNDEFDWEVEHEQLAQQLESSRRHDGPDSTISSQQLEASLSQLVLDEPDAPRHTLGSSVWRHDPPAQPPKVHHLKNVCTVEEIERQLRQNQQPQQNHNYFQPRFPVILQRPPGLQGPVPLPFAPQQPNNNMNQINQPLNKLLNQNQINQMGQNNQMIPNHVNQMGQNMGQMNQNVPQMGQNVNQFIQQNQIAQFQNSHGQNNMMMPQNMHHGNQMIQNQMGVNQMGQNHNQMTQNIQMGHNVNHMAQNNQMGMNQMPPNSNHMGQNLGQMGQNLNQMPQNVNQMPQNVNQMPQNVNQMGQNMNHVMPNGTNFGQMNHFPHMMGQNRMMMPPPGMNMPRQNFSPNMGQFNQNFRGPVPKPNEQQPNMIDNQIMFKNQHPQTVNQMGPSLAQPPNIPQPGQTIPLPGQNMPQPGQTMPGPNMTQPGPNMPQTGPNMPQPGPNMPQPGPNMPQPGPNMTQPGPNMIQTGQNIATSNLSPNKGLKTDKKQQTRIYNNSKNQNQNLTSQSLVQMIQNTHPMLQFNNSFHNATHHPLLNRNQFGNINHPMLNNNQRINGSFSSNNSAGNRSMMNGDDAGSETDEYAGLMTQREKQWLINIQMLQLNTGTPYIHDFYYTVFLERQAKKEKEGIKEAHKANQQNHPFYSGGVQQEQRRERHNSGRHNSTSEDAAPRTYVPAQFENSLGKLQCGSVTAPRKIIDLEVVGSEQQPTGRNSRAPSVASTANPAEVPREMKRTKQLLLDIEALYLILLRLEELNDPLAISNALILKEREEKQKQLEAAQKQLENEQEDESNLFLKNIESVQRRPPQDSPKAETIDKRQVVNLAVSAKPPPTKNLLDEDKDDLINKLFAGLLHGDRLPQILAVRKGRTLVSRFVRRISCGHARLRALWWRVLRATPTLSRRHDDGSLTALAPSLARYIESSSGWATILECCSLLAEAFDPARTPYALTTPFTLTTVCALIEKASTLVNTPEATANERQWSKFLKTLARALKNTNLNVARPLHPLSEAKLTYHLKQIDSRSTIEILQRGKAAEFADLTKVDVHEQLVKHLCL